MKNLLDVDSAFCDHYSSLLETQRAISKELEVYAFDLNKNDITEAICLRKKYSANKKSV